MRKLAFASLVLILFSTLPLTHAESSDFTRKTYDKYEIMQSVNYVVYSLTKMISYNDRVILTNEYENVINNLNFDAINDRKIVTLLTNLMDTLTEEIITVRQKERITQRYKKLMNRALFDSLSGISINPTNLASAITSTVVSAGSVYMNYQNRMEDYRDAMGDAKSTLEDNRIRYLNDARTLLLEISWDLLKKYNISDKYRLTEKQITEFIETTKMKDQNVKYRALKRLLNDNPAFQEFPEFWYYYGIASKSCNKDLSNEELLDIYYEYDKSYKNLFRRNPVYASVAMERIMLRPNGSPQNRKDLEILVANSTNDEWQNYLFAGIKYSELGDFETARSMFQRNIDNGHQIALNSRLLSETYDVTDSSYQDVLEKLLTDNRVSNFDKLFMIGKARNVDYLNKFKEQIEAIRISAVGYRKFANFGPLYIVKIPVDWLFLEESPFNIKLFVDDHLYQYTFKSFDDPEIKKEKETKSVIIELGNKKNFVWVNKPAEFLNLRITHSLIELELQYKQLAIEKQDRTWGNAKQLTWEITKTVLPLPLKSTLAEYELNNIKYQGEEYIRRGGRFQKK
jgi:hypothetical protein